MRPAKTPQHIKLDWKNSVITQFSFYTLLQNEIKEIRECHHVTGQADFLLSTTKKEPIVPLEY